MIIDKKNAVVTTTLTLDEDELKVIVEALGDMSRDDHSTKQLGDLSYLMYCALTKDD